MKDKKNLEFDEYGVKSDERLNNLIQDKEGNFSPFVFNASEMDLYAMETRSRHKLNELIQPILEQVEGERKVRA